MPYSENIIPTMTSSTAPSPYVASATNPTSPYLAHKAFDGVKVGDASGCLQPVAAELVVAIDLGLINAAIVTKYQITTWGFLASWPGSSPRDWEFQGSADGVSWDTLDTRVNETGWVNDESRDYFFTNTIEYRHYCIRVTANNGNATYMIVQELEMYTGGDAVQVYLEHKQLISILLALSFHQHVSMATRTFFGLRLIVSNARNSHLSTGVVVNTADPCYRQFELPVVGYSGAFLVFEQVFSLLGHAAALQFSEVWHQRGYDEAMLEFREVINAELEEELQQLQFSVTVAGTRVSVESCEIDRSGVATVADLTLRNFSDYSNKNVGDPVSVWWLGTEHKLILENKPLSESISQGQKNVPYIFQCVSKTAQLSEQINPSLVASRITGQFSEGTMASELLDFIMDGIAPWSLGVSDFPVGAIEFDDSDRGTALRQLFPGGDTMNQEWVVNTAPDGALTIDRFFGDIVPELLSKSKPDKTVNCSSKSLTSPTGLLYTKVSISNHSQESDATGLHIEVIDNGDGTGFIFGNSVPWNDNLTLYHSALSGLIIQEIGTEEVEFTDEAVEISDYSGSLSKPVYSAVTVDWLDNDNLDPIMADESGALKTETAPGNSVGNFTATTKRIAWEYSNDRDQVAQVVLKYGDQ